MFSSPTTVMWPRASRRATSAGFACIIKRSAPDVGTTGEACYRGTKLDLDHVGLGWRWERVVPSEEYPDGLKWYRILGIRDLLDYDINRNPSGYEWA